MEALLRRRIKKEKDPPFSPEVAERGGIRQLKTLEDKYYHQLCCSGNAAPKETAFVSANPVLVRGEATHSKRPFSGEGSVGGGEAFLMRERGEGSWSRSSKAYVFVVRMMAFLSVVVRSF